jgi:hypothetical protein
LKCLNSVLFLAVFAAPLIQSACQIPSGLANRSSCATQKSALARASTKGKDADKFFDEELAADPLNVPLRLEAVESATQPTDRVSTLAAGFPDTAPGRSARETVRAMRLFDRMSIEDGDTALNVAYAMDPCNVTALNMLAEHDQARGLSAQAFNELGLAHTISPGRWDTTKLWAEYLSDRDRMEVLHQLIASSALYQTDVQRQYALAALGRDMRRPPGFCKKQDANISTAIPFFLVRQNPNVHEGTEQLAVRMTFNGKQRRMLLDTAASGVMLTDTGARGANLKINQASRFAHADNVQVGDFRFGDCDIQLIRLGDISGSLDGIIGIDAFKSFLLTLNFGGGLLQLSALPDAPTDLVAPYLETADLPRVQRDEHGSHPVDAYVPTSMKTWTPFIFEQYHVAIPVTIDRGQTGWAFMMTTMEHSMIVRPMLPADMSLDSIRLSYIRGLFTNWDTEKIDLFRSGPIAMHFAGLHLSLPTLLVGDDPKHPAPDGLAGVIGLDCLRHISVSINMRDQLMHAAPGRP